MKTRILGLVSIMLMGTISLFAQDKTEKLKVYGACGMCETRIEKTVNGLDGVSSADWDKETKMLEVTFNSTKTDVHKVHMAVAKVGHDTDMHKAKDEVYEALPGCCKYERPKVKKKKDDHLNR
jgi:mercuric ion binding protein